MTAPAEAQATAAAASRPAPRRGAILVAKAAITAAATGELMLLQQRLSQRRVPELPPQTASVPMQQRRVLVCQGLACNDGGVAAVWGHWRNEQKRHPLSARSVLGLCRDGTQRCGAPWRGRR